MVIVTPNPLAMPIDGKAGAGLRAERGARSALRDARKEPKSSGILVGPSSAMVPSPVRRRRLARSRTRVPWQHGRPRRAVVQTLTTRLGRYSVERSEQAPVVPHRGARAGARAGTWVGRWRWRRMQTVANSGRRTSNQASRWAAESAFLNSQLLDFRLERRRRNSKSGSSPARTCHQVALSHPLWLVVLPSHSASGTIQQLSRQRAARAS
jgi:hypothetical protein